MAVQGIPLSLCLHLRAADVTHLPGHREGREHISRPFLYVVMLGSHWDRGSQMSWRTILGESPSSALGPGPWEWGSVGKGRCRRGIQDCSGLSRALKQSQVSL